MGELALALVRRVGYVNAGTLEFLVDAEREPYFLEMNTRLQVEHPVTEMVTGVDLVKLQIRIAQGEPLPLRQADLAPARARDRVPRLRRGPRRGLPAEPRDGSRRCACRAAPACATTRASTRATTVPIHYDPLLSKLVVWAESRADAIARMRRAVAEYRVVGHSARRCPSSSGCCAIPASSPGDFDTSFVDTLLAGRDARPRAPGRGRGHRGGDPGLRGPAPRRARAGAAQAASAWGAAGRREAHGRAHAGAADDLRRDRARAARSASRCAASDGRYRVSLDGAPLEVSVSDAAHGLEPTSRSARASHELGLGARRAAATVVSFPGDSLSVELAEAARGGAAPAAARPRPGPPHGADAGPDRARAVRGRRRRWSPGRAWS